METLSKRIHDITVRSSRVLIDEVLKPSGQKSQRVVINFPNTVAMIPLLKPDMFILVKQYRYALQRETLEFPAGKVDLSETLEMAVHRELLEETGYNAKILKKVYDFAPAMGYSTEICHLYFVTDLEKDLNAKINQEEISKIEIKSKKELWSEIQSGRIQDPDIVIGFLLCEKLNLI